MVYQATWWTPINCLLKIRYYEQLREKNADLLLLDQLKVENQRLRLLLNSPLRTDEYKKIAEVLTAETDVYRQQVVINQGERDGAYVGQPVIDEKGMIGQIISVGENTSRVLLLTDVTHSIPVQVLRNDVRVIASGTGHSDELTLDNVPRSVDIEKGDLLVTSGLGGVLWKAIRWQSYKVCLVMDQITLRR